jgi:hypothetical protein
MLCQKIAFQIMFMTKSLKIVLAVLLLITYSCKNRNNEAATLFSLVAPEDSNILFTNTVKNSPDFNIFSYRNFYNGGGVAFGDINNDGLQDVLLTSNMGDNKLYLNLGDFKFKDISNEAGVTESDKWSTGAAMVDINHDGLIDIYICNAGYRKNSNTKNSLYINNGDLTFTESGEKYGLDDDGYTTHAAFFDYDLDGDLDAYILNNSFIPVNTLNYSNKRNLRAKDWPVKEFLKGGGDKLLRNDNGHFSDVSEQAGIYGSLIGFGLGVTIGDVNGDFKPDIYVSNDFFERDYLYINKGDGTFSEELELRMDHISMSSMGADMADLNNDGCPEIFVTDMLPYEEQRLKTTSSFDNINVQKLKYENGFYHQYMQNTLHANNGSGKFIETAFQSGVAASDWSWGALMFDADQDMLNDIFICNGIYNDVIDQDFIDFFANDIIQKMVLTGAKEQLDSVIAKMPSVPIQNVVFQNKGDLKFENVSDLWGLKEKTFSNGSAYADLDNDGDLDWIINNVNQPASVYRNNSNKNFIGLNLVGDTLNTLAIGSKVEVFVGGQKLMKEQMPNRGFQSSCDTRVVFGIASHTVIDSILVYWPGGIKRSIINPKPNTYLTINQNELQFNLMEPLKEYSGIFKEVSTTFDSHIENEFVDFYYERNIPMMLSKEGPKMAVADINGDGNDDIYICGAAGQAGQLYISAKNGYTKKILPVFETFKNWEDTEALFFDANGDGKLDLFVGSGGNSNSTVSPEMQDRLYMNLGNGNFEINYRALPANGMNTSKALAFDYDLDGDMDLFVGSKSHPGEYGINPRSFLYENMGDGQFKDALFNTKSELSYVGMVTDAIWENIEGSPAPELVLLGEWMAPKVFRYNGTQFVNVPTSLDSLSGWWQSIHSVDIDNDGDLDLILGNIGNNGYLQNEAYLPLKMFINDYDGNGMPEKILTRTVLERDMPVVMKREMVDQLNKLKKQNLKHRDFASKSIQDLLGKDLQNGLVKSINTVKSYVAINEGNGKFVLYELPVLAQVSSINDIVSTDFNKDGKVDLIVVGNRMNLQPQYGQLDGNHGIFLMNQGSGQFKCLNEKESGIYFKGVATQIQKINQNGEDRFIVLRNNDKPFEFKLNISK